MTRQELIQAAKDALGKPETDDYRIQPSRHAEQHENKAPELAEILKTSEIQVAARQYEAADKRAGEAQNSFKRLASRSRWAVLVTAFFGVVLMLLVAVPEKKWGQVPKSIFITLGIAGVVVGGLGTMWISRIREGKLLDEWMQSRALAETRRLAYFSSVTRPHELGHNKPEVLVWLQQLEYFRRYQLDVQISYYRQRGHEHRVSSRKILSLSSWAVFLSSLATGTAGALGYLEPRLASIAGLTVLGSALSSFASSKEAANQDGRNAERYARTLEILEQIESRLDRVREAVVQGEQAVLKQFVKTVHEQLSLEHRQWLKASDVMSSQAEMLEEALERQKSSLQIQG